MFEDFLRDHGFPVDIIPTRPLFRRIVEEHILPAIHNDVKFEWVNSHHNPARLTHVDGIAVDQHAREHPDIELRPDFVDVPDALILGHADEIRAWHAQMPLEQIHRRLKSGDDQETERACVALELSGGARPEDLPIIEHALAGEALSLYTRDRLRRLLPTTSD